MFGQAVSFAAISNRIYTEDLARFPRNPQGVAPFVVNAPFSVDVYLKTLHAVAGNTARGHALLELYDELPETRRIELSGHAARFAPEHAVDPSEPFRDLLTMIDAAFEKWRYVYELERSGMVRPQTVILIMRACHEACRLVVAQLAPTAAEGSTP